LEAENSLGLGITGIPGGRKNTFIENLGVLFANKRHNVAVLAVDSSSRRSGGSILAGKMRMDRLAVYANAVIRSPPTGDTLGGVAARIREIFFVCKAAGFDVIPVDTPGVGQSETQVASMVDFFWCGTTIQAPLPVKWLNS
jgi:LAO/AO transport system kinase